jgi:aminoglycoside phosphotransferase family enzyme
MRRFEQSAILSNVATTAGITPELARRVADVVFESHRQADRAALEHGAEAIDDIMTSLSRSLAQSHRFDADHVRTFSREAQSQLERSRATLDDRAARGYVRRCHGDLHLANIVLWQGRPVLYDAIEFDEGIATTDTLYDLAFLLMDLDRHSQRRAANEVLNRYLWRSSEDFDLGGLIALPLLLGVRAGVRAVVSADRAAQEQGKASQSDQERAQAYLQAAIGYLTPPPPQLIAVGGLSGTGKTTLAAALAPRIGSAPGAVHVRSDLERKSLFGAQETMRLGAASYLPKVSQEV